MSIARISEKKDTLSDVIVNEALMWDKIGDLRMLVKRGATFTDDQVGMIVSDLLSDTLNCVTWRNVSHSITDWTNLCIESQCNLNAKTKSGNTLLIAAAFKKKYSLMLSLLEAGADPNIKNTDDESALDYAIKNRANYTIVALVAYGSHVSEIQLPRVLDALKSLQIDKAIAGQVIACVEKLYTLYPDLIDYKELIKTPICRIDGEVNEMMNPFFISPLRDIIKEYSFFKIPDAKPKWGKSEVTDELSHSKKIDLT